MYPKKFFTVAIPAIARRLPSAIKASSCLVALAVFLSLAAAQPRAETNTIRRFVSGSLSTILANYDREAFLMALWSLDCPPCRAELALLGEIHQENPRLRLVLISTDDGSQAEAAQEVLHKSGLDKVESWIFAESNTQRLRYEIDAAWYGELPRSYFYTADHTRVSVSGALKPQHLESWLAFNEQ
ncbi:MAG: TlpA family protein disulfide reductase [Gammaproteobacteria bacterium]